jgi:protein-tyrosine-phosphatase
VSALRVLFVCTANAGRSQMAEALANHQGRGRVHAESAGSRPAGQVNPLALDTLREFGVPWGGRPPRSVDGLERLPWDYVITVCDNAKESCPVFPGAPQQVHWSIPDPNDKAAFRAAFLDLSKRIEALLG